MKIHIDVTSEIVPHDICVGCGICSGGCPSNNIPMKWAENGDRIPFKVNDCPPTCNVCLDLCPFNDHYDKKTLNIMNEDSIAKETFSDISGINYTFETGYYLNCYAGWINDNSKRMQSSSGGMLTWTIEYLLQNNLVDAAVVVRESKKNQDVMFEYYIANNLEELKGSSSSRYYPVDMGNIIRQMNERDNEKRFVVVGLPCALKGLRFSMKKFPRLRKRIKYMLGIVCGHTPNKYYSEYISRMSGLDITSTKRVDFRVKDQTNRAGNFNLVGINNSGEKGNYIPFLSVASMWSNGAFQHNACNYCDDVFAEVADAVFMDAWLPRYEHDVKGTSLILTRNPDIKAVLEKGNKLGNCYVESVEVNDIIKSQEGLVFVKKQEIAGRLFNAINKGEKVPTKRVQPSKEEFEKRKVFIEAKKNIQEESKKEWVRYREEDNLEPFNESMKQLARPLLRHKKIKRMERVIKNPYVLLRLLPHSIVNLLPSKLKERALK